MIGALLVCFRFGRLTLLAAAHLVRGACRFQRIEAGNLFALTYLAPR
jgi:hypothetical protein